MLYTTITINDKDYKCRLTAKACVDLEKKFGTNPLNYFVEVSQKKLLMDVEKIILILHASLQSFEHSISIEDTYALYDAFIDEGKTIEDVYELLNEIFKVSGFYKEVGANTSKN